MRRERKEKKQNLLRTNIVIKHQEDALVLFYF